MKRILLLCALVSAAAGCKDKSSTTSAAPSASAPVASASAVDPQISAQFNELDTNHDGKISMVDVETRFAAKFTEADLDKDGNLSPSEFEALNAERQRRFISAAFEAMDKDGDGKVSLAEAPPHLKMRFEMLDLDKDGQLSLDDLNAAQMSGRSEGAFKAVDKDTNGTISKQEFIDSNAGFIQRFDSDGDKAVTLAEMVKGTTRPERNFSPAPPPSP